jgi:hypothetical protein
MGEIMFPSEPIGTEGTQKKYSRLFQRALKSYQVVLNISE